MSTTEERIDDIPILGPNGDIPQSSCESEIKIHVVSYVWVIHHFNYHKEKLLDENEKILKSPVFPSIVKSSSKWYLTLLPNTSNYSYTTLHLKLDDTSECKTTFGKYKISFLDENKKELKVHADNDLKKFEAKADTSYYGCVYNFKTDDVLPSTDKLRIYCQITFSEVDPLTNTFVQVDTIKHNPNVPELRVVEDIRQLFINEEFTDFVVSVKGKNYKVHKTILIARCPVFATMFKHERMKESQQNEVDISDFDEKVVEEMLNYIYSGKSENLEALAEDLLAAAEKYGLAGLKNMSENALAKRLSAENAIDTLILADLHNGRKLKSHTINFIVAKSPEVMKSAAWKNIAPSHPHLLVEMCEALSSQIDCKLAIKNP